MIGAIAGKLLDQSFIIICEFPINPQSISIMILGEGYKLEEESIEFFHIHCLCLRMIKEFFTVSQALLINTLSLSFMPRIISRIFTMWLEKRLRSR